MKKMANLSIHTYPWIGQHNPFVLFCKMASSHMSLLGPILTCPLGSKTKSVMCWMVLVPSTNHLWTRWQLYPSIHTYHMVHFLPRFDCRNRSIDTYPMTQLPPCLYIYWGWRKSYLLLFYYVFGWHWIGIQNKVSYVLYGSSPSLTSVVRGGAATGLSTAMVNGPASLDLGEDATWSEVISGQAARLRLVGST